MNAENLRKAADLQDQIDDLQRQQTELLGEEGMTQNGGGVTAARPAARSAAGAAGHLPRKRVISPEGLERIRAAQKARWARQRSGKPAKKK